MNESEKKEAQRKHWDQRHWNPMTRMAWSAEIAVERANKEKGDMVGFRIFPTGEREMFQLT